MPIGLIGRKCGMTRVFTEDGTSIPVSVIEVLSNRVTQVKTIDNDGYQALQVTWSKKPASRVNKPAAGHFAKANVEAGDGLHEFCIKGDEGQDINVGSELKVDLFQVGQKVDVRGVTRGKGFAGTVKRHNFRTQDATHGNSLSHRAPGSIGQRQTPGRVFKGKRMSGHMGDVNRVALNQSIVKIDVERNLILVKGAIPGAPGGKVVVLPSVKNKKSDKRGE
ncbi:MAG: 50S ribosomal protein L3 [Coxiellaceae bacterium]|nr:MAG: 50S ribosomal protein L3 [Coxiellaceae bacterium]